MHRALARLLLPAALALPIAAHADRIEVSADGLERVTLSTVDSESAEPASGPGASLAPFGTAPDWSNALRLQVGGLDTGDLDGDGDIDIAVGCYTSQSFPPYPDWHDYIYFNVGGALEATPSWTSSDQVSTGEVKIGFLDEDAYPDVFAANGGFAMSPSVIYFGTAAGPATTPGWTASDVSWTNHAVLFDFDHDGDTDVFTANQGNDPSDPYRPMYGYVNHADTGGTLETAPSWQSAETSIQNFLSFGDLDGDGWEDLAVSKWSGFESGVYLNSAGSLAATPSWTTGSTTTDKGVGWADVDGDDDPDLALGHDPTLLYTNTAGVLAGTWSATGTYFGHSDLKWADVELDGYPDLAEIHFANGVVRLYRNLGGSLETVPSWSYDSAGAGTALAFGDITGNGFPDLVVGNSGDVSVMVFYNRIGVFADAFERGSTDAWSLTSP